MSDKKGEAEHFEETARQAERALDIAESGKLRPTALRHEGPRAYPMTRPPPAPPATTKTRRASSAERMEDLLTEIALLAVTMGWDIPKLQDRVFAHFEEVEKSVAQAEEGPCESCKRLGFHFSCKD